MATLEIKDAAGKAAGKAELPDSVYAIEPNMHVMHRTVKAQRAGWRQGTANTKTRGFVSGGGKKPWRQKGTGRARQGSIRSPQWRGGGTVFGPHTRSYAEKVNSKEIKLAMRSALSAKLADGELVIVKPFEFEKPCTKDAVAALKALQLDGMRIKLIIPDDAVDTFLSFRNIPGVEILPVNAINTYDIIDNKRLVIVDTCLPYIEEVLG
ncbi:MAG: 50S ribosomal protein L4 [Eggerthellaceae bacterium]|nr:50S ribosomal protein L4 [Eggerthellaceae bacterium]